MESGIGRARPSDVWSHFLSTPVDVVAARFGLEGARSCVVAACSSSTIAIGQGADAIRFGRADAVLAGGTDALARLTFSGFNALRLMDGSPCRPFDRSRAGMNIGEGAASSCSKSWIGRGSAARRSTASWPGYAFGCEAFHPTAPEPEGRPVAAVIERGVTGCAPRCLGGRSHQRARNRHASERRGRNARVPPGLRRSHAHHSGDLHQVDGWSLSGRRGRHRGGDSRPDGQRGWIPPTIHHQETDEACRGDIVANQARESRVRCGVSMSLAFGGNDSAIVIKDRTTDPRSAGLSATRTRP